MKSSKALPATLAGIGVGLVILFLLVETGLFRGLFRATSPVIFLLALVGGAAAIGGAGGLITGAMAGDRKGAMKGLLTGAAVGGIAEAVALLAAYLTTAQRSSAGDEHASFAALAIVFLGLVGASVGGPVAVALVKVFRRSSAAP